MRPIVDVAHGPYVVRGNTRHGSQVVDTVAGIGAGHDRPCLAIPVQHEALSCVADVGHARAAHGPYVVRSDGGDAVQYSAVLVRVGAWHDIPACAIPMDDQG